MRFHSPFPALTVLALLAGCTSTPASRIAENHAAYEKFPAAVQQKVSAGQVDIGFTPEMVRLALGKPSQEFTRQTELGATVLWIYLDNKPQFTFGVGVGSYDHNSAGSVGVSTTTGGHGPDERVRVEFRDGRVTAVEYAKH